MDPCITLKLELWQVEKIRYAVAEMFTAAMHRGDRASAEMWDSIYREIVAQQ